MSVDETLPNRYRAKAAMISLLPGSLIQMESISFHLLLGNERYLLGSSLPEAPGRAGRGTITRRGRKFVSLLDRLELMRAAQNCSGSHELSWALKPAFHTHRAELLPVSVPLCKALLLFWALLSARLCGLLHSINA